MSTLWIAVVVSCAGCAALKQVGLVVPSRWMSSARMQVFVEVLPVGLLSAR